MKKFFLIMICPTFTLISIARGQNFYGNQFAPYPEPNVSISPTWTDELAITLSGGEGIFRGSLPPDYLTKSQFSYSFGIFYTALKQVIWYYKGYWFAPEFKPDPIFDLQYQSIAASFMHAGQSENTMRLNYIKVSGGLAFPFIELLLGISIPISGTSILNSNGIETTAPIFFQNLKFVIQPQINLYYVFNTSYFDFIIPYASFSFPATKVLSSRFSLDNQSFYVNSNTIDDLKMWAIKVGIKFMFDVGDHDVHLD